MRRPLQTDGSAAGRKITEQMIRLIASDIDGTLLQNGEKQISPRVFKLVEQLEQRGVRFVPASGRPIASLRPLFEPGADQRTFLCENGALLMEGEHRIGLTEIPRGDALEMAHQITAYGGLQPLVSGASARYVLDRKLDWLAQIGYFVGHEVTTIGQFEQITEPMIKVTAWCPMRVTDPIRSYFESRWADRYSVAIAGDCWLDLTLADKGKGLHKIAEYYGIRKEEILVFGDNFNDIPMFREAGIACAMQHSAPEVKKAADRVCGRVEDVLAELV